jgi:hypothetical protein
VAGPRILESEGATLLWSVRISAQPHTLKTACEPGKPRARSEVGPSTRRELSASGDSGLDPRRPRIGLGERECAGRVRRGAVNGEDRLDFLGQQAAEVLVFDLRVIVRPPRAD